MITRFVPSPSGFLHLGHAYAAYIAHCWAAHFGEKMRLRIEDIDHVVSRDAFTAAIFEDLHWLDIPYYSFVTYQQPCRKAKCLDNVGNTAKSRKKRAEYCN